MTDPTLPKNYCGNLLVSQETVHFRGKKHGSDNFGEGQKHSKYEDWYLGNQAVSEQE